MRPNLATIIEQLKRNGWIESYSTYWYLDFFYPIKKRKGKRYCDGDSVLQVSKFHDGQDILKLYNQHERAIKHEVVLNIGDLDRFNEIFRSLLFMNSIKI